MHTGRSTDHTSSTRMDELSLPADSGFNRQQAWDKLHARLHTPKAKPSMQRTWWSIAAMLTLMLALYAIFSTNKRSGQSFAFSPAIFIPDMKSPQPSATLVSIHSPAVADKSTAPSYKKVLDSYIIHDTAVLASNQLVGKPVPIGQDTATGISPDAVHTTAAPAKKKLGVVYFNEIARSENPDEVSGSGTGVSLTIPGIKKDNTTTVQKAEAPDHSPDFPRNRWLPFNKNAKPKE
ncbi:MAG: hypothetical protein NTW29_15175 [Bacteroidetes bacterium]|nr:hypothetical protein [Bacteroidota bacterium]